MARTESRIAMHDPRRHMVADGDNNPERISWEILRTRQQMDRTLDELGRKLAEISRTVRKSVVMSVVWIAMATVGAVVTWRVVRHRRSRHLGCRR